MSDTIRLNALRAYALGQFDNLDLRRFGPVCESAHAQILHVIEFNIIDWEATAKAHGWKEVENPDDGPILWHEKLERFWPVDDWEGAANDLALEETDFILKS